jgi:sterol 3beta-glucosyltransferase
MEKARVLGEKIRSEDGVGEAIKAVYRDMEYARGLVEMKKVREKKGGRGWWTAGVWGGDGEGEAEEAEAEDDEMWTLVDEKEEEEEVGRMELKV